MGKRAMRRREMRNGKMEMEMEKYGATVGDGLASVGNPGLFGSWMEESFGTLFGTFGRHSLVTNQFGRGL
jgi:hypothetical protein